MTDPIAEKAEQLIKKAEEIAGEHSEILCIRNMIYGFRLMGDPMNRFMTDGFKAQEALQKAKELNPENPRVYILEAQEKFFTPEAYGGSKTEAKALFEKAMELLQKEKKAHILDPQWGKSTVAYFLQQFGQ
ncbi:MAG: hypothetical protein N2747_00065 [Chitinophagaceae bacterium]|nr:hypothetical protein [Chitinophagaceae bacterium]